MEIAAIPPMTPPAMAPAFGLCLPSDIDVPVLEVVFEAEMEPYEPDAPSAVPGPSSGEPMKVKEAGVRH